MKLTLSSIFKISVLILGSICASGKFAIAQVTPDASSINTQVNQNGNVAEITGGQTRGGNLFHSFQDFSVPTGNEAFFNNADSISNILSRVTGGNVSNIDGLIRANGSANLFLINPAGIIFGENARLDIGGSFLGSTSSSILFEDGEFSATDLDTPPLLTVNAPIGLSFRDNPGDIINRSTFDGVGLAVNQGQSISLIGGNVNLENGGMIFAPGGRVELGGLIETGTINIAEDNSLTFPSNLARGDVSITDSALVSVFSTVSGSIGINASNLSLDNGGLLDARGGDLVINATDKVSLVNASAINVSASGGGSVTIDAKNLELTTGSNIFAGIFIDAGTEDAQAGDITINTSEDLLIDAVGEESTQITNSNFGTGNAGNIAINSRNVFLINGQISSSNNGRGSTGDISINATGNISVDGITRSQLEGIRNFSSQIATGTVGNIELQAQNLIITNGGFIQSLVTGEATNSGNININILDTISIDGSQEVILPDGTSSRLPSIISSFAVDTSISGNSGNININTQNLFLSRNGNIDASVFGRGSAGDININADWITIGEPGNTSLLPSYIGSGVFGDSEAVVEEVTGGKITINTGSLFISDGGDISVGIGSDVANITGTGTGGNITINATDTVSVVVRVLSIIQSCLVVYSLISVKTLLGMLAILL